MRNLHPFYGGVWPALRVCPILLPDGFQTGPEASGPCLKAWQQNLPAH
jgi:hypothetical protein